jgi:UTP:GlnB (protein PII) uridylyltransferase
MATERQLSQTKDAIRKRRRRDRLAAEEEQRREEDAAIEQCLREQKEAATAAKKANQNARKAKSLAKKKKDKEALALGFNNGSGSAANFTSFRPPSMLDAPGVLPNDGAASAANFSPLQPSIHASLPDGIEMTMHMMAASQKDLSDYDLKLVSGQAAASQVVHDSVNQFQSRLMELVKLKSPQRQTNGSR